MGINNHVSNTNVLNLSVSNVIKKLMKESGVRESELVRQTGLPQTTINRLLLGETLDPRANTLIPIAKFFNVSLGQLLGLEAMNPNRIPGTVNPTNKLAWSTIPIISWEVAHSWLFQRENINPNSHSQWITTEKDISPESFGLPTMPFMEPRFRKGSIVIVDPQYVYQDGSFVVVSLNSLEPTVRRIIKDGADIYLKKLYGSEEPSKMLKKDNIIGTILETRISEN